MSPKLDSDDLTIPARVVRVMRGNRHDDTLVIAKVTFDLRSGSSPVAAKQEALTLEGATYGPRSNSLRRIQDLSPTKLRSDVLVVGSAFAPGGALEAKFEARVRVAGIDKTLVVRPPVFLERDGRITTEIGGHSTQLSYELARGDDTWNPFGLDGRTPDGSGRIPLPRIEVPSEEEPAPGPPAGFGPVPLFTEWEVRPLGQNADGVVELTWEGEAAELNAAPPDQQIDGPIPDEIAIELVHLHPSHAEFTTTLERVRPIAHVPGAGSTPLVPDTLLIDTDRCVCLVTYRASLGEAHVDTWVEPVVELRRASLPIPRAPGSRGAAPPSDAARSSARGASMPLSPQMTVEFDAFDLAEHTVDTPFSPTKKRDRSEDTLEIARRDLVPATPFADSGPVVESDVRSAPVFGEPPAKADYPAPPPRPSTPAAAVPIAPSSIAGSAIADRPSRPAPVFGEPPPVSKSDYVVPPPRASVPHAVPVPPEAASRPSAAFESPTYIAKGDHASPPRPSPPMALEPPIGAPKNALQASNDALAGDIRARAEVAPKLKLVPRAMVAPRDAPETIELLWFANDVVPRLRTAPGLVDAFPPNAESERFAAQATDMTRDVRRALLFAKPALAPQTELAIDANDRKVGVFRTPLLLVVGELAVAFDAKLTLEATIASIEMLLPNDKTLRPNIDAARKLLDADWVTSPVLDQGAQSLRDAVAKLREPNAQLVEPTVERLLLEKRAYRTRQVFGGEHLRLTWHDEGRPGVPIYVPAELKHRLPLYPRLPVRALVDVRPRQDAFETHAAALLLRALGRRLEP